MFITHGKVTSEEIFVILSCNLNTETNPVSEKLWYQKSETAINAKLYEGWNFNSGNYLFTTDTK